MRGAKHAQLIASQDSLLLLGESGSQAGSRLAVPFGQPFTLGPHRIELFSSGHALGSASLLVKVGKRKVVYAGTVNPRGSALGGALDHRSADILVISARYGASDFAFPDQNAVLATLGDRCEEIVGAGGVAVLLVRDAGKALDLALSLAGRELPVQAHRSFYDAARRSRRGVFGKFRRWAPKAQHGRILLWPIRAHAKLDDSYLPAPSERFLVSGQAIRPENIASAGAAEGFVLSNQADHRELVRYIQSSGAGQVYVTNASCRAEGLQNALPKHTIEVIGPPEQLSLFAG